MMHMMDKDAWEAFRQIKVAVRDLHRSARGGTDTAALMHRLYDAVEREQKAYALDPLTPLSIY